MLPTDLYYSLYRVFSLLLYFGDMAQFYLDFSFEQLMLSGPVFYFWLSKGEEGLHASCENPS